MDPKLELLSEKKLRTWAWLLKHRWLNNRRQVKNYMTCTCPWWTTKSRPLNLATNQIRPQSQRIRLHIRFMRNRRTRVWVKLSGTTLFITQALPSQFSLTLDHITIASWSTNSLIKWAYKSGTLIKLLNSQMNLNSSWLTTNKTTIKEPKKFASIKNLFTR